MNKTQQDDIALLDALDKKRHIEKCHYCDNKSKYTQPEKNTGQIIDVCEGHFTFKYMA
jgi:hypothetical protein